MCYDILFFFFIPAHPQAEEEKEKKGCAASTDTMEGHWWVLKAAHPHTA